ncbi:MAG TPA: hypothetical protein VFX78_02160 [Candidatus Eisenbacteria bacterium]|nr:hypothetical protein [Candidatus Eisenbacteria bacterium]
MRFFWEPRSVEEPLSAAGDILAGVNVRWSASLAVIGTIVVGASAVYWAHREGDEASHEPAVGKSERRCLRLGPVGYFDGMWWGSTDGGGVLIRLDKGEGTAALAGQGRPRVFDVAVRAPLISIGAGEQVPDVDRPELVFFDGATGARAWVWHLSVPQEEPTEAEVDAGEHVDVVGVDGEFGGRAPARLSRVEGPDCKPRTAADAETFGQLVPLVR